MHFKENYYARQNYKILRTILSFPGPSKLGVVFGSVFSCLVPGNTSSSYFISDHQITEKLHCVHLALNLTTGVSTIDEIALERSQLNRFGLLLDHSSRIIIVVKTTCGHSLCFWAEITKIIYTSANLAYVWSLRGIRQP